MKTYILVAALMLGWAFTAIRLTQARHALRQAATAIAMRDFALDRQHTDAYDAEADQVWEED